jgi:tetratricopeptide (TPR) repeat protein
MTRNNESTIEKTIESVFNLNSKIIICDIGSKDNTVSLCNKYKLNPIKIELNNDLSQIKNEMLKISESPWNFYIEPWEILISGKDEIKELIKKKEDVYNVSIIQNDIITKQIRLFHKEMEIKFKNPVYETINFKNSKPTEIYISSGNNQNSDIHLDLLKKWQSKNPLATEPIYYTACFHLINKNWDSFLNLADLYLHQEKSNGVSVYMTNYYCSMVNCYIKKDYHSAIKFIVPCIAKMPTMSEFWCLLGDIYYAVKDYEKAKDFYENALIIGQKRRRDDDYPVEISKYKEYPEKMINSCERIKDSTKGYVTI